MQQQKNHLLINLINKKIWNDMVSHVEGPIISLCSNDHYVKVIALNKKQVWPTTMKFILELFVIRPFSMTVKVSDATT